MPEGLEWSIDPLSSSHDRGSFDCGSADLNDFLRRYAHQNDRRDLSRTFVATRRGENRVVGYFTLRAGEIQIRSLPTEEARRLPKYPLPTVHLARLAVDRAVQGQGLGECLLFLVMARSVRAASEVGVYAIEVMAESASARAFYKRYGFSDLLDDPFHLYLPIDTARDVLGVGDPPARR